jgi:uncharacterized membrane protein HdeD (DUF308 family)
MNALAKLDRILVARGIASVAFGVFTVLGPGSSVAALVYLYGAYALVDGALLFGFGFRTQDSKWAYFMRGLVSVAAGVLTFVYPGLTAVSLYILIGAWAISAGAVELGIALAMRKEISVGGLVFSAVLSIVSGIALLALPAAGVIALVSLIAAYAIANGIALLVAGVRLHQLMRPMTAS